ncbi:MAG: hypothetical protein LBI82_01335, partial [Dysgonamonadaceae bacterium]|nr:hypothetical protein [Dysgonamonadaceae bacterium]
MMNCLKIYFSKLQEVLKKQSTLHFVLLVVSVFYLSRYNVWVVKWLGILFFSTFILQSLILKRKCYLLFIVRVLIVIFLGFQFVNIARNKTIEIHEGIDAPLLEVHEVLGFRLKPNLHDTWFLHWIKEDTVKMCTSTDDFSRRIPDDAFMEEYLVNQSHPDNHAVFLGCSFTFGEGVAYSSTFPYLFEKLNPNYKSYNYGVPGFGPHQIALLFDKRVNTINEEAIPEKKGFALYTYMDDHLNRVFGGSIYLNWTHWCSESLPNVNIENDSLVIKRFSKAQLLCAKALNNVALFKEFDVRLNYPKTESFYKRFASIINYTAKKYWELKPDNHFYVSIYPGYGIDLNWVQ